MTIRPPLSNYFSALRKLLVYRDTPSADDLRRLGMARDMATKLAWIPWLRMVGVGNSVAMYGSGEDSDIDLFIVAAPGRIWLVRSLVTLSVIVFSRRKTRDSHKDTFCLSFFATENGLDFGQFTIEDDIYLAYWVATMKPIWNPYGTYDVFIDKNHHWYKISPTEQQENIKYALDIPTQKYREYLPWLWTSLDRLCKTILLPKTLRSYEKLGRPYGIRVSDDVLKFHDDDRRVAIRDSLLKD